MKPSRWLPWLAGGVILALVIAASRHVAEARGFARLVERAEPWWLLLAVGLQAITYVAQAQVFRVVARAGRASVGLAAATRLGLAKLFADQAVPSAGLSGTVVMARGYERRGLPRAVVAAGVVVDIVSGYVAYVAGLAVALVIAAVHDQASSLLVIVAVAFLVVAVGLSASVLVLAGRAERPVPRRLGRFRPVRVALDFVRDADPALARDPRLVARASAYQGAIVLADAATVWVLLQALGVHGSPAGVFASFMISTLVRLVGVIPGGLGAFEATSVVTLRLVGVPVAAALAATLLFRGLSFWLPMLPGLWVSRRELAAARAPADAGRGATRPEPALAELLAQLATSTAGLTSAEAARRRPRPDLPMAGRASQLRFVREFLRAAANPLVLVLLAAGAASAFLGEVGDAVIIGAIVALSAAIDFRQTYRSARAVRRLQGQVAPTAIVLRDGAWGEVPRDTVVAGDVVRLAAGDLVPADARLVDATDLHVQQSALTGESMPAEKHAIDGRLPASGPDSPALVYLGTSVVSGTATAVVFAAGPDTAFGDIVERLAARPEETEFERGAHRFGMLILQTVVALVLFILVVNVSLGRDALTALLFSVALAVGLTPEFLPVITNVTLAQGATQMARDHVIVKHLASIQNVGSIDVLCSDKTGTLTAGTMTLDGDVDPLGHPGGRALALGRLNARFETGIASPLDAAILAHAMDDDGGYVKIGEVPFDFERRRLSVIVERAGERLLVTKGAPESVIAACARLEVAGEARALDAAAAARCLDVFRRASAQGLRVLAVAYRVVTPATRYGPGDERELTLVGFLTFADHLLAGTAGSIQALRRDGVAIKILTGDNELVTRHICEQVGIRAGRIVLGDEVGRLDDAALAHVAEQVDVFARVSPAQKHRILQALRGRAHVVGFLGDGVNDAPSLHAADVGISVAGAVDVAREASDIILLERRLDVLHAGILAGRRASANVVKYLLMGTSSNFGNMFSMAGAALILPFLPMLPTQILLNNFLYDLAQITIPTDRTDPAYTERPQRWDIGLIRRFMLVIGPISSVYDFLTFFVLIHVFGFGETLFHTGWFVESLTTQALVLFVIRTVQRPWVSRPSTALTFTTLAVVAVALALPFTALGGILGFAPLPPAYFGFLAVVVGSYLVVVEVVKAKVMRGTHLAPSRGACRGHDRARSTAR